MSNLIGEGDGQTPLQPDEVDGLIPSWVSIRGDLDRVEQEGIAKTISWARSRRLKPNDIVDEPFVRQLHKQMFGGVWQWAGRYRQTNRNIGIEYAYIPEEVAKLVADARDCLEKQAFPDAETAVRFHHKLVWIHPFPNGNGRHGRLAADLLLAACGGGSFTWGKELAADPQRARAQYIVALREADAGNFAELLAFARN